MDQGVDIIKKYRQKISEKLSYVDEIILKLEEQNKINDNEKVKLEAYAGEHYFIDARIDNRRAGLAVAGDNLQNICR